MDIAPSFLSILFIYVNRMSQQTDNENVKAWWKILDNTAPARDCSGEKELVPKVSLVVRSPEYFCRNT